ncbi:MAG: sialate O-acetylesterase [Luteolibacter sp.]
MKTKVKIISTLTACLLVTVATAAELNPLFQDNAVLQCNSRVPVWGTGRDGEKVTVSFGGQTVSTVAKDGVWKLWLKPMPANATPQKLTISGDTARTLSNILVGEVWVASGQSNMERQLGARGGQQPIANWQQEVAAANHPQIRQFYVQQTTAPVPQTTVKGNWAVCSPETVKDFSAVGYFFARDLLAAKKVPIGIIHSSWGGTPAEAWTSEAGLQALPDFIEPVAELKKLTADPDLARRNSQAKQNQWFEKVDRGSKPGAAWSGVELEMTDWKSMTLPTFLEAAGYPKFDGVIWFRRTFDLPETWDGSDVELHLGCVDDMDTTWVNGEQVGMTNGWDIPRNYQIPGRLLKAGGNVIAVRVYDPAGGGGIYGGNDAMRLVLKADGRPASVPLSGEWRCKPGCTMKEAGWPPSDSSKSQNSPTALYNGMIAPLLPYSIRGVIWYQGEANVGRERQYRTLFPAMIADWRRAWNQGDFPFLFVQIAPHQGMSPEIREAQLLSWKQTKNTAMTVTLDCGDAKDIHPTRKEPVGARLALAARALAYGEKIEFSGPVFEAIKTRGADAFLNFTHPGGGLVAKDGELKGFTLAGADKVFHPAKAEIRGNTVVVSAAEVSSPVAVRYAWANAAEGNLFNRAGLPASPFRTDVE